MAFRGSVDIICTCLQSRSAKFGGTALEVCIPGPIRSDARPLFGFWLRFSPFRFFFLLASVNLIELYKTEQPNPEADRDGVPFEFSRGFRALGRLLGEATSTAGTM